MKSSEAQATTPETPSAKVVPLRRAPKPRRDELEFLPAALEIVETPASPLGRIVAATLMAFFAIALAWACIGHIDVIASAQGKIVPVGRIKVIQPFETGTVTAINVKDGDRVREGQVLVELDRTVAAAERNRVRHDLLRAQLDAARLVALRASLEGGIVPADFTPPKEAPIYEVERTRATMLAQANQQVAKIAALDQQIEQKNAEAEAIAAVIVKLTDGLPLVREMAEVREKAMKIEFGNRIAHLDAQLKLNEQRHELIIQHRRTVEIAAARQALEAQREQAKAEYVRTVMTDLAEAEVKTAQFSEDLIKAEKRVQDQTLRAPIAGAVQQMVMHTIGGVVTPAQTLMVVVPEGSGSIEIEAMILNKDIGFVQEGQDAEIKIDTFNFTKYGLLQGKVLSVSQDAIIRDKSAAQVNADRQSGQGARSSEPPGQEMLYAARVSLEKTRMQIDHRLVELSAGMAVTVEIKTDQRRIIEYVLSPLLRYQQESLRER